MPNVKLGVTDGPIYATLVALVVIICIICVTIAATTPRTTCTFHHGFATSCEWVGKQPSRN
jgi:hypothetical protein